MTDKRSKIKGRKESGQYMTIPYCVLESENFIKLSGNAIKLLIDLFHQYNGRNNGAFIIAWSHMSKKEGKRGWNNKETLKNALGELIHFGFVIQTKEWGKHNCSQYAVTWRQVDVSDNISYSNLYVESKHTPNLYKHPKPEYERPLRKKKAKLVSMDSVKSKKKRVVNDDI